MKKKGYDNRILISQYGKPIMQYQLRHTFACLMLYADEGPADIANALGHSDLICYLELMVNGEVRKREGLVRSLQI